MIEYIFLGIVATLIIVMILFRNNPIIEKYWKYTLILLPAVILVVLSIINKRKDSTTRTDSLVKTIDQVKTDLHEANLVAAIKVAAANQGQKEKIDKLSEIKQIDDQSERIKKLAEMMN